MIPRPRSGRFGLQRLFGEQFGGEAQSFFRGFLLRFLLQFFRTISEQDQHHKTPVHGLRPKWRVKASRMPSIFIPLDPFTSTTSEGSSNRVSSSEAVSTVSNQRICWFGNPAFRAPCPK